MYSTSTLRRSARIANKIGQIRNETPVASEHRASLEVKSLDAIPVANETSKAPESMSTSKTPQGVSYPPFYVAHSATNAAGPYYVRPNPSVTPLLWVAPTARMY